MKAHRSKLTNRIFLTSYAIAAGVAAATIAGCTAYDPQGAAQQYAPSYYNQSYDQLNVEQKCSLRTI